MPKQISENKRNMILNGNLSQTILMLAVPVMINSFIQSMYNLRTHSGLDGSEQKTSLP